jgi:Nif-specific regulatory protein
MTRETDELSLLFDIACSLGSSREPRELMPPLLVMMSERMGLVRGTLTVFNRESGEIFIECAHGLSDDERSRGRYRPGEGVTGTVVQSGHPIVIPSVAHDPTFLNKTKARGEKDADHSFMCVPVKSSSGEVIGTFSADRVYDPHARLNDDVRFMTIVATLISQSVERHQRWLMERTQLEEENRRLRAELIDTRSFDNMIGKSQAMKELYTMISLVSETDATAFILGESGVGKELVASSIHYNSKRAQRPFIKVNCGALPDNLIESELFGHEKGAFTGAIAKREGRFEAAEGGTIFLDEIGDLPLATQVKLLRVLQEQEFERLGSSRTQKCNVRVIAATNRPLEDMIDAGTFRADLYYRLNVFPVKVPALRERKTDIMPLCDHFAEKYAKRFGKRIERISTAAAEMLMAYAWPGNVRELENCIERAVVMSCDGVIRPQHLPISLHLPMIDEKSERGLFDVVVSAVERDLITDALKMTNGNMAKAAKDLGVSERVIGLRVKEFDIDITKYKNKSA